MRSRTQLRPYQRRSSSHLFNRPEAHLWLDKGLGKTVVTLTAFEQLLERGEASHALVAAPSRVVTTVWAQEAAAWEHTAGIRVVPVAGGPERRVAALAEPADVHVISWDSLWWLAQHLGLKAKSKMPRSFRLPWDTVIWDESTKAKNLSAKRGKAARYLSHWTRRRWALTGDPSPNSLLDLFNQAYIVDHGRRLGTSKNAYRDRFFRAVDQDRHVWVPRKHTAQRVPRLLADITLRFDAEKYLKLAPPIVNDIPLEFGFRARRQYNELQRKLFLRLDRGEVSPANCAVAVNACRQACGGAVYLTPEEDEEPTGEWEAINDVKLRHLAEFYEELGTNLLVVYQFRHERDRIMEAFDAPAIGASNNDEELIDRWNAGRIPMLLTYPCEGLNLQHGGHHIYFYTLPWSNYAYEQTIGRLHRTGALRGVIVHRPYIHDTVEDNVVIPTLARKHSNQRTLFNGVKRWRMAA